MNRAWAWLVIITYGAILLVAVALAVTTIVAGADPVQVS